MQLSVIPRRLAICRLPADSSLPAWAVRGSFHSIVRTASELSIVCDDSAVPAEVQCVRAWRAFRVQGSLDLSLTGVLASLAQPLAEAAISIFAVSTFDTDYILVREADLEKAAAALTAAGHHVQAE